jgi:hypothetical protein
MTYTHWVAEWNSQDALQWAGRLGNERMRNSVIESVAENWLRSDRGAATAWINNSSLTSETKKRLLSQK